MSTPIVLMDAQRIRRSVKRMAYEIVEKIPLTERSYSSVLTTGGNAVAKSLEDVLADISDKEIQAVNVPVKTGLDGTTIARNGRTRMSTIS
ncbi:MAG: hypothetical protein U5J63_16115 [Fodinibius sp.]|nr:hypothetical protein [Fodinibius sp.]